uniref:Mucolipin TRP cation channel 2 n=1 Tax=Gadus morhua TaxID=8049 RepID=A0A8C5ATJ3_GADMO
MAYLMHSSANCNNRQPRWPSTLTPDVIKEDTLRDDLRYYFMSPCEKYRSRRILPWKLGVQILKIIMITTQLILFGLNNQLVVSYQEENRMALKNLFLKDYSGMDEDDYSISVYTQQGVYDSLFYVLDQYSQLGNLSVGPIGYADDETGGVRPLVVCKRYYKRGTLEPSDDAYDIDAELEHGVCVCVNNLFIHFSFHHVTVNGLSFLLCSRLVDVEITFHLKGINLQSVRARELPDCYAFSVTITLDNQGHSGKMKIFMDIDSVSSACLEWKISGTAQKNTQYLLVFDVFVIMICIASAVLCTRSIVLAVRLLQRFTRFFQENYNRKLCDEDQSEFLNGWYLLIIVSDLLAIVGSILKMEIQAKSLTNYDVCSIFLGTSTLMVWFGVIRYLGYFEKYNVLILTMKAAFPKVLRFCCCAGMIYLGYTFCGWIVLGPYHEKFESLSRVAECLFSLLNGDDMFSTFAQLKDKNAVVWFFSRAYLYSFISLFIYMVLSLFIALITDAYDTIKNYQKNGFPLTDLHKFLRELSDFDSVEDGSQTGVGFNPLCCCQRYVSNRLE